MPQLPQKDPMWSFKDDKARLKAMISRDISRTVIAVTSLAAAAATAISKLGIPWPF